MIKLIKKLCRNSLPYRMNIFFIFVGSEFKVMFVCFRSLLKIGSAFRRMDGSKGINTINNLTI